MADLSDVAPLKSDNTSPEAAAKGYTLASGTTYYYELFGPNSVVETPWRDPRRSLHADDGGLRSKPLLAAHLKFDANIIITSAEIETSNFSDVATTSTTVGDWITENPPDCYIACEGNCTQTDTDLFVAKTTGAAGGAMIHFVDNGALRARLKLVVAGTGGVARLGVGWKE